MHESYVSLEIAKLLKKLGFKWGCRAAWDLTFPDEPYLNYDAVYQTDFNNDVDDILYAPTLSVAQRWLREVKKLYIEIRRMPKCDLFDRYFTSIAIMQEPFDTEMRDKDDEINEFFNKWDNKRFCFEIQEIDGKKYLVDCDKGLDNYGYKIELKMKHM